MSEPDQPGMPDDGHSGTPGHEASLKADVHALMRFAPDGAIDEDMFCLSCGYNLRGLRGDPVRCPECGGENALAEVALPAKMIRQALRALETQPTRCVTYCVATPTIVWPLWFWLSPNLIEQLVVLVGVVGLAVVAWYASYLKFAETMDSPRLARWIIWRFHATAFLVLSPLAVLVAVVGIAEVPPNALPFEAWAGAFVAPFLLLPLAIAFNRPVQKARERAQRDTAVRIARDVLRRQLVTERPR